MAKIARSDLPIDYPDKLLEFTLDELETNLPNTCVSELMQRVLTSISNIEFNFDDDATMLVYVKTFISTVINFEKFINEPHLDKSEKKRLIKCQGDYIAGTLYVLGHLTKMPDFESQQTLLVALTKTTYALLITGAIGMRSRSTFNVFNAETAARARKSKKQPERRDQAKEELRKMGAALFPKSRAKAKEIADELRSRLKTARYPSVETIYDLICELAGERGNLNNPTLPEG